MPLRHTNSLLSNSDPSNSSSSAVVKWFWVYREPTNLLLQHDSQHGEDSFSSCLPQTLGLFTCSYQGLSLQESLCRLCGPTLRQVPGNWNIWGTIGLCSLVNSLPSKFATTTLSSLWTVPLRSHSLYRLSV